MISAGFLFRSTQEAKLATRSYFQSVALNLAEAGLEEGLYAFNTSSLTLLNGWTLVIGSTTDYQKTITTGLNFTQATGAIYVRVDVGGSGGMTVTAAGVISIPNQRGIIKQLRVAGTGPRKLFSNGAVGKSTISFSGSADIDSYDSALGPYNTATNRSDRATVSSNSTVQVSGSSSIYGYVSTNGVAPDVGASGRIYGATSPSSPNVDPTRVRTDFNANLTDATEPTGVTIAIGTVNSDLTLPRVGDVPRANGRYLYRTPQISLGGGTTLTINGPVDLISDGAISITGSSQVTITNGANSSFNLYCDDNIDFSGNGMVNNTQNAAKATIWGTNTAASAKTVQLKGSSAFVGTVYTPNSNVQISGSAGVFGAVIGKAVTISGSVHFDVALMGTNIPGGPNPGDGTTGYGAIAVSGWTELRDATGSGSAFARDNRAPFTTLF